MHPHILAYFTWLMQILFPILAPTPAAAGGGPVTLDGAAPSFCSTGANASYTCSITFGTGLTDRVAVFIGAVKDTGTVSISSITGGGGGTWTQVGSNTNGNTEYHNFSCWYSIAPTATGATNLTINHSAAPTGQGFGYAWSFSKAKQTTPIANCTTVTAGSVNVTGASNDLVIWVDFDSSNNRGLTAGDCPTTTLDSAFGALGHSSADCAGTGSASKFTANGYSSGGTSGSGATAVNVLHD